MNYFRHCAIGLLRNFQNFIQLADVRRHFELTLEQNYLYRSVIFNILVKPIFKLLYRNKIVPLQEKHMLVLLRPTLSK